jgi:hypothetical protein
MGFNANGVESANHQLQRKPGHSLTEGEAIVLLWAGELTGG